MLDRILIIGLGGSAETLVRYLNSYLERSLLDLEWEHGLPAAWRWLCIDIAEDSDVVTDDVPDRLGDTGSRIGVARYPFEYSNYFDQLTAGPAAPGALDGCLPERDIVLPPPFKGAGQRPQVGYAVALAEFRKIAAAIDREVREIDSGEATEQLTELSYRLKTHKSDRGPGTRIFVASSLCGGSGAGLLQPVVELLLGRATTGAQWLKHELATVLFTPDVFVELKEQERDGISANALYTTSSMLNGYEATGAAPPALIELLAPGGGTLSGGRRAAMTNFFVGGSNGKIAFNHQHHAIKATAKALQRVILDEQVAEGLRAHLETNRIGASVTHNFRIVDSAATSRPASSLGYASVSLGASIIANYTAERMARATLETMLGGHRLLALPGEREDDVIERLRREREGWYLESVGLTEEAVLGGLRDHKQRRGLAMEEAQRIKEHIGRGSRESSAEQWLKHIDAELDEARRTIQAAQAGRDDAMRKWSEAIIEKLLGATATSVAEYGAPTTMQLLETARVRCRELASELEVKRREKLLPNVEGLDRGRQRLSSQGARKLRNHDPALGEVIEAGCQAMFLRAEAEDHQSAAQMLKEFEQSVIEPLMRATSQAAKALAASKLDYDRKLVAEWATDKLPPRLLPAPNELLLEPANSYPALVDELLERTVGGGGVENAVSRAAAEVITGVWPARDARPPARDDRPENQQTLIDCSQQWHAASGITSTASFTFGLLDANAALARAHDWTRRRRGALGDRLELGIADWIEGDPGRPDRFAEKLGQALRNAAPLTTVNPGVHMRVHGTPPAAPKLYVSTLPISDKHRIRRRIEELLRGAELTDGAVAALFDPTSSSHTVEVSGFSAQPMHPVTLDGLFVPIQRDWQERINASMREQFSAYRRTRPLPQFVPLSPDRLRGFVRGWFIAEALGLLEFPDDGRPLYVHTPEGRKAFPERFLGKPFTVDADELLCAVLESMPLAIASYACEQWEALEAYMHVLDLGESRSPTDWLTAIPPLGPDGTPGPGGTSIDAVPNGDFSKRRLAVVAGLEAIEARWRARIARRPKFTSETFSDGDRTREIDELALGALGDLRAALVAPGASGNGSGSVQDVEGGH